MSDMSLLLAGEAAVPPLPAFIVAATEDVSGDEIPELVEFDSDDDDADGDGASSADACYAIFCDFILRFGAPGLEFITEVVGLHKQS